MIRYLIVAACLTPGLAFAAGGGSSAPPTPTETTKTCSNGQVWDSGKGACVNPQSGGLDADTLYGAVREFAYAGQYENAQKVLAAMPDQTDDRVLTYWGFTERKLGDVPSGMAYYAKALEANPDNSLARSYMGQALVEQGKLVEARVQLNAIRASGDTGTWPEEALARALSTGATYSY
ncbi:tetratricopeptide repeat protein [Roseovarius sp. LXJ103]|uniref:tetratricopeptide repeat protein n=1 Tax=Roseovarius carneus TaxID=2853164 RepID=UPI000D6061A0|nr:tetratricopeptide repeat protein [Roseovarius carneus]MBZ8118649.1 tetratricopeptide repeat protein [Roseovarius carneus]PWE35667.1 hypothetical protein DD563_06670 [Pelagicola sp. LXJ1103]